ncbi:uncharacterized protein LOC120916317 [Rana temporaria]|uniref:uncharacterized protein LOC120916317 n=1 Tax=Rana temporaria TaxID=8407 RepID=UPI001AAD009D|nr:uncharacterized protein LOC120916317 [Rana temporaria]
MMEDLLGVLFLLCALAAPGHSLSCLECVGKDSTCKGVSKTCYDGSCGLVFQENTEDGKTSRDYWKVCIGTEYCNKVGSISHISGTKKIGISCCYTDDCTPSLPKLPANSPEANAMTCPTCRDVKSSYCKPQINIKCSGNERMCIDYQAATPTGSGEIMKGCASQGVCDFPYQINYRNDKGIFSQYFQCEPGIPTGSAVPLSCFQCAKTNSACQGFKVTCPLEHSCGFTYREITEDGKLYKDYIKSCMPTKKCDKTVSITHVNGTMKMGISCCDTDSCTPSLPRWPADSSKANGLSCPTCRDLKNGKCNPESELQCTGSELMCVAQSTETAGFKESAMGCATKSVCDMKSFTYKNDPAFINVEFSCDPTKSEAQPAGGTPPMCVFCRAEDALECEGKLDFCPKNTICGSSYRVTVSAGNKTSSIARSCVPEDKCNIFGTMSITGKRIATGTSCCKEDGCTPSIEPWKPKLAKLNEKKCKTCLSSYADSCETNDTLECRGDENECVSYAMTMSTDFDTAAYSFRGCGTKALCDAQNYLMIINDVEYGHRFTCT